MTCYMCGGQKLTSGSYVDIAMTLSDFFADDNLDIVPSDIAAAMICLVNVHKQKQIDCKNELLKEGGLFAKDRALATRLWKQYIAVNPNGRTSLKKSLNISVSSEDNDGDIETGFATQLNREGSNSIGMELQFQTDLSHDEEGALISANALTYFKPCLILIAYDNPS